MSVSKEPQRCPFCGNAPSVDEDWGMREWLVICVDYTQESHRCWLTGPIRRSRAGAVEAWNRIRLTPSRRKRP